MRKHKTSAEKFIRASWYRCLKNHGLTESQARRVRDWTDSKIMMILKDEAKPVL